MFLDMLYAFKVKTLADVRSLPGSNKFPHFNKENLDRTLPNHGIQYIHFKELGGRRKVRQDSTNTAWRNKSFQGYADYMETGDFKAAVSNLKKTANAAVTAIMCAEAVWWRCHRSMIADYLKKDGWEVMHIMSENKSQEHPFTSPARVVEGELFYN